MNSTTYTVEYRFLEDDEDSQWLEVDTFDHGYDAREAYWNHLKEFKYVQCRIRETTVVHKTEERVVAEYSLLGDF
jgi:hypothetical protein